MYRILFIAILGFVGWSCSWASQAAITDNKIQLESTADFSFVGAGNSSFLIMQPLKENLRSVSTMQHADGVGVIYLGRIKLGNDVTPLTALRGIAVQISKTLNLDLSLITDSTTAMKLAPNELLLLYHPQLIMTLALTRSAPDQYDLIGTYAIPSAAVPDTAEKSAPKTTSASE